MKAQKEFFQKFAVFLVVFVFTIFLCGLAQATVFQNLQVVGIESLDKIENQVIEIPVSQNETHFINALVNIDNQAQSVAQTSEALVQDQFDEVSALKGEIVVIEQSQNLVYRTVLPYRLTSGLQEDMIMAALENRQYNEVEIVVIGEISGSASVSVGVYNASFRAQAVGKDIGLVYMIC